MRFAIGMEYTKYDYIAGGGLNYLVVDLLLLRLEILL